MPGPVVDILLLDLPVALWRDTSAHYEALVAALPEAVATGDRTSPGARLMALTKQFEGPFAEVSEHSELELRAAAARGTRALDVAYSVPREARDDLAALAEALDAGEQWLRGRGLGHLVASAEIAAFRRWFLGELVSQLDGGFPVAWDARS